MSTTTIYIIVTISLLHFVAGIVFLIRKLSGPTLATHGQAKEPPEDDKEPPEQSEESLGQS